MCNQPCKTTSLDVAKLAGVSRSTVSRVVNGYPNVPETTRKRVLEVIAQYGYVPSVSAKTLRGVRARCVGVFLSDGGWPETVQAELLYAFSQSAQARGYMTLSGTLEPYASPGCEQQVRNVLNSGCVDAGVFLNPMGGAALFQRLLREGQTVGILGMQPLETQERLFSLAFNRDIARQTISHVLGAGYRAALLVSDPGSHPSWEHWRDGFLQAAEDMGLAVREVQPGEGVALETRLAQTMTGAQAPLPMICADTTAVYAAYHVACQQGIRVGRDVSLLGMGLLPRTMPLCPAISAYRFDIREMVESIAGRIIRSLEGAAAIPLTDELAYHWSPGGSFV